VAGALKGKTHIGGKKVFWDGKHGGGDVFSEYEKCLRSSPEGAILASVVGGTLSEGINFSDDLARAVVVLGVPFPNCESVEVKQQLRVQGPEFYENVTMRAVNQCIGRVIRHAGDYGLLVLVDERFVRLQGKLSGWLQGRVAVIGDEAALTDHATSFFTRLK
jgi:chromosome transmission fidelity protein 1